MKNLERSIKISLDLIPRMGYGKNMIKIGLVLSLLAFGLLSIAGASHGDALADCQEKQSFDTCFSSLNR